MKIKRLIKLLGQRSPCVKIPDFTVKGISCNSKDVLGGYVFVAIKGCAGDGNKYIDEAIKNGAKAVVFQSSAAPSTALRAGSRQPPEKTIFIRVKDTRQALGKLAAEFYGHPSRKVKVVGITGTNGKTTVSYLLEKILQQAGYSPAVIGTINYRFRNKIIPAKNTTPGPLQLQSLLARMHKAGIDYCAMEASSHALDQKRTEGVDFSSAIFTNLTQDHLDYHKTLGSYFRAKAKLFRDIRPGAFVVVNNDDKYGRMLKKLTAARVITYGIKNSSDIMARDIKFDTRHTEFTLVSPKGMTDFKSRLIGRHNVYNILAAIAWALKEGLPLAVIRGAVSEFTSVPGRLERVESRAAFSVFVDYAHTQDALENIISTLRHLAQRKIITVFGCGGERDKGKRPKMGEVATELSDYAIITNDNPRSEDPRAIISDIKKGIRKKGFCVIYDRLEAIKKALCLAEERDIVLIAGKGHEDYQVLKNKRIYFDDRKAVRECLESMGY